jgi:aspartate kinase
LVSGKGVIALEKRRIVFKFGGKSLSEGEKTRQLAEKILSELKAGKQIAIVVSAIGNTTDTLIEYSNEACGENISRKDLDEILAMGERTSTRLFTAALKARGVNAKYLDPSDGDWPIITDENFGNANPIMDVYMPKIRGKLEQLFNENIVPVIPGFIGKTSRGEVTTLGRGGSDTTAFLVAKAIGASEVIIVTDVAGILSADPKIVPNPKTISKIDVEKLANLCDFDAKFIHRKALKFLEGSFKVRIISYKNSKLDEGGTIIQTAVPKIYISAENPPLACITIVHEKSSDIWRIVPKVLRVAEKNKIQILMFSADANSLTLYVYDADAERAAKVLHSKLMAVGRINCFFALAVKRGIRWTKLLGVEIENFHKEMEALKNSREKFFGVLTAVSNIHFFTVSGV